MMSAMLIYKSYLQINKKMCYIVKGMYLVHKKNNQKA